MFGSFSSKSKLKKEIYDELVWGDPIEPVYGITSSLTPNNEQCWGADERDFIFYKKFDVFDQIANEMFENDPFRLQELDSTLCSKLAEESPQYGRSYSIFHNKVKIGSFQVADGSIFAADEVYFHIEIFGYLAQCLAYEAIFDFVAALGSLLVSSDEIDRIKFSMAITRAMNAAVWQRDQDGNGEPTNIELLYHGIPSYYLNWRESRRS